MAVIRIFNTHCVLEGEADIGFLWALDRELSFQVQGAEHTRAFKGYVNKEGQYVKWDGMHHLLTETLTFPSGLLRRVQEFYQRGNRPCGLVDVRASKSPPAAIDIIPTLKALGKEPYPYQIEAALAVKEEDRGIIRLATGGGKCLIAALITALFGKRTILYVIGRDLLYQTHKFFSKIFNHKIGIIGDGNCDIQDINVASVWTVGQALGLKIEIVTDTDDEVAVDPQKYIDIREMLSSTKVHIFDECHLAACNTIQEIAKNINPEHLYGMSASPWRDDNADLLIEGILGKNIVDISASYLIDNGFLVKPVIKFLAVPPSTKKMKRAYQTIYKNYITDNPVRNELVVKWAEKLVEQRYQTLVLYNSVAHGELLYKEISKKLPCILLSGKDSSETRERAKQRLEDREINCIIASRIFDIGVDLPSLSGLIIASGGKSSVRALQRIGRVIRKHPGKKQAA
ncbi:MAG TPA: DEAD/DEAH box helicase, partial [Paenisporosarcina sp.]|nr:DEAD/DEAH box helicase [Paenisporosarcina sp.]